MNTILNIFRIYTYKYIINDRLSSHIKSKMFADSVISISSIMRICGFQVDLIQATFLPFMNTHLNDMFC